MKIIKQMMIIGVITFIGELLNLLLPLPVPGSVYGMILLFLCLVIGIVKVSQIEETANFLITVMPIMFVAPSVGLMNSYSAIANSIPVLLFICFFTTITTMSITGLIAQFIIKKGKKKENV